MSYGFKGAKKNVDFGGAQVSFNADQSRASKLGMYADITVKKWRTAAPNIVGYTTVSYRDKIVKVVYR